MKSTSTTRLIETLSIRISLHQVLYQFDFIPFSLLPFETEMHQMQLFHGNSLSCQISHQNTLERSQTSTKWNKCIYSAITPSNRAQCSSRPTCCTPCNKSCKHEKWRSICSSKVEKSHHVVGSAKSLSAKLKHWADISISMSQSKIIPSYQTHESESGQMVSEKVKYALSDIYLS